MPFRGSITGFGYGRWQNGSRYYSNQGKAQWAAFLDSSGSDEIRSIVCDASNNVYLAGYATPGGVGVQVYDASGTGQNLTSFVIPRLGTGSLGFLTKYNTNGNCQWVSAVDTATTSESNFCISVDLNNNIYAVGTTTANTSFYDASGFTVRQSPVTLNQGRAAYIYKIDSNGITQWATGLATTNTFGCMCVSDTENNVYYSGGYANAGAGTFTLLDVSGTTQKTSLYTLPQSGNGQAIFLIKLDSSGQTLWSVNLPTGMANDPLIGKLAVDKANNVYLSQSYSNAITFRDASGFSQSNSLYSLVQPSGSPFRYGAFLTKYSSNGKVQWATYFDASGTNAAASEDARALAVDEQSNIYWGIVYGGATAGATPYTILDASGTTQSNSLFSIPVVTNAIVLIKYDINGKCQWATYANCPSFEYTYNLSTDTAGNIYFCGYANPGVTLTFYDASGTTQSDSGVSCTIPSLTGLAGILAKYNQYGKCQWATYFTGSGNANDVWFGLAIDGSNSIYVGGYNTGNAIPRDASGNTQSNSAITITPPFPTTLTASVVKYR